MTLWSFISECVCVMVRFVRFCIYVCVCVREYVLCVLCVCVCVMCVLLCACFVCEYVCAVVCVGGVRFGRHLQGGRRTVSHLYVA